MKKRTQAFRPAAPDLLEGRVVLSQVLFTPVTGVVVQPKHAEVAKAAPKGHEPAGTTVQNVTREKLANGQVRMIDTTIARVGAGQTSTWQVTHEPDGTTEVVDEIATPVSPGTTTIAKSITLADGAKQSETGTDQTQASTTTVLPGGVLEANPGATVIASQTTTFDHIITQAGLGSETIIGTMVHQPTRSGSISVTDQEVTLFDGSKDEVKIVATRHGNTTVTQTTTTPENGEAATSTVRTATLLSSTRS